MSSPAPSPSIRWAALAAALVGLVVVVARPVPVGAQERPKEMPYAGTDQGGELPLLDPAYRMESHKVVLITDGALNPRLVKLKKGQLVAWISYARLPSVVVFEREVARKMICHSLVNFSIKDDEIRSQPIHAGEFASFCQLQPGRYAYKVVRPNPGDRSASSAKVLTGEIIVSAEAPEKKD